MLWEIESLYGVRKVSTRVGKYKDGILVLGRSEVDEARGGGARRTRGLKCEGMWNVRLHCADIGTRVVNNIEESGYDYPIPPCKPDSVRGAQPGGAG